MADLTLSRDFPIRGAAEALRKQLIAYLSAGHLAVGEPFLTDAEVVERSGLSRSTVRRALDEMQREGWIERRVGQGTYVGPRAAMPVHPAIGQTAALREARKDSLAIVRMAVLIFEIGDLAHDWYTPLVLEGLDQAAEEFGITVELLGNRDRDIDAISRRLTQSRPDVLVCLAPEPKQAFVIRDAQKLGIQCFVTGTPHMALGLPCVSEDNRQGMALAVRHLLEQGHRRIGLALERKVEPWVFDRHEAFLQTLSEAGVSIDDVAVHWIPATDPRDGHPDSGAALHAFIQRHHLSALIAGSYLPMLYLDRLVQAHKLRVPQDLSVISFEQNLASGRWLGGIKPTYVALPMKAMGRKLAELAQETVRGLTIPGQTILGCELMAGESVTPTV